MRSCYNRSIFKCLCLCSVVCERCFALCLVWWVWNIPCTHSDVEQHQLPGTTNTSQVNSRLRHSLIQGVSVLVMQPLLDSRCMVEVCACIGQKVKEVPSRGMWGQQRAVQHQCWIKRPARVDKWIVKTTCVLPEYIWSRAVGIQKNMYFILFRDWLDSFKTYYVKMLSACQVKLSKIISDQ